jgi:hypothetical protein
MLQPKDSNTAAEAIWTCSTLSSVLTPGSVWPVVPYPIADERGRKARRRWQLEHAASAPPSNNCHALVLERLGPSLHQVLGAVRAGEQQLAQDTLGGSSDPDDEGDVDVRPADMRHHASGATRVRSRGLTLPIVRVLARDLLAALAATHAAGWAHGDVKPSNVLLAAGAAGKLLLLVCSLYLPCEVSGQGCWCVFLLHGITWHDDHGLAGDMTPGATWHGLVWHGRRSPVAPCAQVSWPRHCVPRLARLNATVTAPSCLERWRPRLQRRTLQAV